MTEEIKAAEAAEKEKADFEASLEGLSEEEKSQKLEEKVKAEELLKHKAEVEELLRKERERADEATRKLEETRQKGRENYEKRKKEREESGNEPEPLTKDAVREMLEEEREIVRREMREEQAQEIAKRISETDSEAKLTVEIWKNRKLQGTLPEQMEEAHAIATSKRIKAQKEELERALLGSESGDGLNPQRKTVLAGEPKLDVNDKSVVKGMVWDSSKGAYKKTIAGGRKIFYVSRDLKRNWVENASTK